MSYIAEKPRLDAQPRETQSGVPQQETRHVKRVQRDRFNECRPLALKAVRSITQMGDSPAVP
jgi:hypothetical protein